MYVAEVVDTILSVDRTSWDALAGDEVFSSYGWLRTVEETYEVDLRPRYVLVSQAERLVGAAVCYLAVPTPRDFTLDGIVFGRFAGAAAALGLSLLPALVCGRTFTYGRHLLTKPGLGSGGRQRLCRRLLGELERLARREDLPLCFDNVFEEESELVALLQRRGYVETSHSPVCYLDVRWPTFEGYLRYLRSKSRNMARNAKREISRLQHAGLRIQAIEDTSPHDERLFELADRHWYSHNREPFPYRRDFFRRLRENLGRHAVVHGAFVGSSLVGFSLVLDKGGVAYGLHHGVDSGVDREAAAYFNLCFYAPTRAAIAASNQRIYFGRGLPEVKMRRGCRRRAVGLFYRSNSRSKRAILAVLLRLHTVWIRVKTERVRRRVRGGRVA